MEKTDKEHYLTIPDILAYLKACGITCERKSTYNDVAELRKFGLDIVMKKQSGSAYYYLNTRALS